MSKPRPARSLAEAARDVVAESFARQGFAATELVTRWPEIAGEEIARHAEPIKVRWPRAPDDQGAQPGTLVLRVEGPAAIEIQHLSGVIIERVNRFFGWRAVDQIALRQAPLRRREKAAPQKADTEAAARIAATLGAVADDDLRAALARLGAAVKSG